MEVSYYSRKTGDYDVNDLREVLAEAVLELKPAHLAGLLGCIMERMVEAGHATIGEVLEWTNADVTDVESAE